MRAGVSRASTVFVLCVGVSAVHACIHASGAVGMLGTSVTVTVNTRVDLVGHVGVVGTSIGGVRRLLVLVMGDSVLDFIDDAGHDG